MTVTDQKRVFRSSWQMLAPTATHDASPYTNRPSVLTCSHAGMTAGEIIFTGSKNFWKTKTNLEITVIYYKNFQKFEVIAADPAKPSDERRLYADYYILKTKLDHDILERQTLEEHEAILRQKKIVEYIEVQDRVILKLAKDYLLSRLNIVYSTPSSPRDVTGSSDWYLTLQPAYNDVIDPDTGRLDVLCLRPLELEPYQRRRGSRYVN